MSFESVRPYVQLASGLSDLTRARAMEAAQGLLSLPAVGIATGTKMASQAVELADELLATAAANRSNVTTLVRGEVDVAISRLGLVPVQKLQEVQAEAARLRAENAQLRSAASTGAAKGPARKAAAARSTAKKATKASAPHSAVTTRTTPAGA